jgi:hypothetical protein
MAGNISYNQLMWIYENAPPYKNTNEYPYSQRHHRYKYFIPVEVNGKIEFNVHYYWGSEETRYSMAEFEQFEHSLNKRQRDRYFRNESPEGIPYVTKYVSKHKPFGIVRDDNTVEILCGHMGQGERMIISEQLGVPAYFMQEASSGGVIFTDKYAQHRRRLKRPAFTGMRFNVDTGELHESSRYKIDVKVVDRKKSNQLMKEHVDKLSMIKMFYNSTDAETLTSDMKEAINTHAPDAIYDNGTISYLEIARRLWDTDAIASSYFYVLGYYIGNAYWAVKYGSSMTEPTRVYKQLLPKLRKDLKGNADVFNRRTYWDFENNYPSARWGLELTDMQGNHLQQISG